MGHRLIIFAGVLYLLLPNAQAQESGASKTLPTLQPFQDCRECPRMMPLPAGRFIMGANDQRDTYGPAHDRSMPYRFAISTTEVTFDQYETCARAGACRDGRSDHGWGRGAQPMINVSWDDAQDYASWLSRHTGHAYRLPTEVEWEYAARSGTVTRFPWGDLEGEGNANCRHCGTPWSGKGAAPVAQFSPNAFGLYDMNGNVSEWVADCWRDRHTPETQNQSAETRAEEVCSARVTRGGDWYYIPILSTSAARKSNAPNLWSYTIGIRVVRDLPL